MNRGEIWTVAGGVYASKPRPAVILQDRRFDGTDSVTVIPLTTTEVMAPLLRMRLPTGLVTGLDSTSYAMVDKITTVRRSNTVTQLGKLSTAQMIELERLILVFLGLAD